MSDEVDEEYNSEEVEEADRNRRRWLLTSHTLTGIPPNSKFKKKLAEIKARHKQGKIPDDDAEAQDLLKALERTNIATEFKECPCHDGCKVDHGIEGFAKTANRKNGRPEYLKVKEDTGSRLNWIHPTWVDRLVLPVVDLSAPMDFTGAFGSEYTATQKAELCLIGQSRKSMGAEFVIGPSGFPVDGVTVGTEFIQRYGHVHTVFADKKPEAVMLIAQSKKTEAERTAIEERRAEAERRAKAIADRQQQQRNIRALSSTSIAFGGSPASDVVATPD